MFSHVGASLRLDATLKFHYVILLIINDLGTIPLVFYLLILFLTIRTVKLFNINLFFTNLIYYLSLFNNVN